MYVKMLSIPFYVCLFCPVPLLFLCSSEILALIALHFVMGTVRCGSMEVGGVWWLLNILDWKLNRRQWWREMEKSVFKTQQTEISEKPSVTNLTFLPHCNLCCTGRNKDMTGGPHTQMQQLIKAPWHWGERKCVYSLESTFTADMDRIEDNTLIAYSGRMEFYKQRI